MWIFIFKGIKNHINPYKYFLYQVLEILLGSESRFPWLLLISGAVLFVLLSTMEKCWQTLITWGMCTKACGKAPGLRGIQDFPRAGFLMICSLTFMKSQSRYHFMERNGVTEEVPSHLLGKGKNKQGLPAVFNLNILCSPCPNPETEQILVSSQIHSSQSKPSLLTQTSSGTKSWLAADIYRFFKWS